MTALVKSRWRFVDETTRTDSFLKALGIEFRNGDSCFWRNNEHHLRDLYKDMISEARVRIRELHPDVGGDGRELDAFIQSFNQAKRAFARHLPAELNPTGPAPVVRRGRKTTQSVHRRMMQTLAARRRRANPEYRARFNALRRARYQKLKAEGKLPKGDPARYKRYREKHRDRVRAASNDYRLRHPEKVRQWKHDYWQRRGKFLPRRRRPEPRTVAGTQAYERRREWRKGNWLLHREKVNASRRVKHKLPRQRDSKGRYFSYPQPLEKAA